MYENHLRKGNEKMMDVIKEKDKSPETLRLPEKRQEITKQGNIRFEFNSNLSRKLQVFRRPDKRGGDGEASTGLGLLFRKNKKNQGKAEDILS